EPAAIHELEQGEAAVVGQREHRTERRFEPLRVQAVGVARTARWGADEPVEGTAKATARFEAVIELQIEYGSSLAYPGQRQAHAPRAMIGVESHAAIALERAPGGRRVDAAPGQIDIAQPDLRFVLDRGEQLPHERRRAAPAIERKAAAAWAVAGMQRVARRGEELDVFALGRTHAARGAAKNAGGRDADEEDAFER